MSSFRGYLMGFGFSLERVLFESSSPILFICSNKDNQYFLFLRPLLDKTMFMIVNLSKEEIFKLLEGEKTIRYFFKSKRDKLLISEDILFEVDLFDKSYLPDSDSFLSDNKEEFKEDIEYFKGKTG